MWFIFVQTTKCEIWWILGCIKNNMEILTTISQHVLWVVINDGDGYFQCTSQVLNVPVALISIANMRDGAYRPTLLFEKVKHKSVACAVAKL